MRISTPWAELSSKLIKRAREQIRTEALKITRLGEVTYPCGHVSKYTVRRGEVRVQPRCPVCK